MKLCSVKLTRAFIVAFKLKLGYKSVQDFRVFRCFRLSHSKNELYLRTSFGPLISAILVKVSSQPLSSVEVKILAIENKF